MQILLDLLDDSRYGGMSAIIPRRQEDSLGIALGMRKPNGITNSL